MSCTPDASRQGDLIIPKLRWAKDSAFALLAMDVRNLLATGGEAEYWSCGQNTSVWISYWRNAAMDDTPLEIKDFVFRKLMERSGEERFLMGCRMFDAARDLVLASLPPDLSSAELKTRLFERIYGFPLPSGCRPVADAAIAR